MGQTAAWKLSLRPEPLALFAQNPKTTEALNPTPESDIPERWHRFGAFVGCNLETLSPTCHMLLLNLESLFEKRHLAGRGPHNTDSGLYCLERTLSNTPET